MASTYFKRTGTTTVNTYTFSAWIKLGTLSSANNTYQVLFSSGNQNILGLYGGPTTSGWNALYHYNNTNLWWTNNLLRDTSAWYHVVAKVSSGTVTTYINGVQTSYATSTYSLGALETTTDKTCVGVYAPSTTSFFTGSMANVEFVSGTALGPEYFGSTDTATGIWKPGGSSTISDYGADGFKLKMDTTSPGADTSGKGNTFTASGTPTLTQGSPSNVWANMATPTWYDGTIANGGNTVSTNQSNYRYQTSSIGVTKGKWYWEVKLSTAADYALMGITCDPNPTNTTSNWILGSGASDYSVVYNTAGGNGNKYNNAGTSPTNTPGAFMGGFAAGNIIMFALDCDNNTLKIGTNNSWSNGSGSTNQTFSNTTPISITDPTATNTGFYFASVGDYGGGTSVFQFNFGEGFFATTAAGTQADDNGQGLFAYDVPAGYYALNTKNLEAYG